MTDSKVEKIREILQKIKSEVDNISWNDPEAAKLLQSLRDEKVPEAQIKQLDEKAKIVSKGDWRLLEGLGNIVGMLGGGLGSASGYVAKTGSSGFDLFGVIIAGVIGGYFVLGQLGYLAGSALNSTQQRTQEKNDLEQCCRDIINTASGIEPVSEISLVGSIN